MVAIRYRGTSPKLGSSQGECPYPCAQVSFGGGDEEGGGVDVGGGDDVVRLSSNFQGKGSPSKVDARVP